MNGELTITLEQGADFSAASSRGLGVTVDGSGHAVLGATGNDTPTVGVLVGAATNASTDDLTRGLVTVQTKGVIVVKSGNATAITPGDTLTVNAAGKFVKATNVPAPRFMALGASAAADTDLKILIA